MFYFSGDVLLSFQLNYGNTIITPDDVTIDIYLNGVIINSGVPVRTGEYYNYVITINDADILPNFYNSYRFTVTAAYNGETIFVNGYFIVHLSDYPNYDNTVVLLSNEDSELYMPCEDLTREQCLTTPPVKPQVLSIEMYKMNSAACDCYDKK